MNTSSKIGVLALQGGFALHIQAIESLGAKAIAVKDKAALQEIDGLIIPGGESSTFFNQIKKTSLTEPLLACIKQKPVFGTCAGLILLAKSIENQSPSPFGVLDLTVKRNGYGSQKYSFSTDVECLFIDKKKNVDATFIRAPLIIAHHPSVKVLATYQKKAVLVQQEQYLAATFHPEMVLTNAVHNHFLHMVQSSRSVIKN